MNRISENRLNRNDILSILLLIILYILQGIPIGLQNTIPVLLNNRVPYSKIAILSLVTFPFSIKLLWAPLLDFYYVKKIGKRKSWIIPVQVICGIILLYGSFNNRMDRWLFPDHHHIILNDSNKLVNDQVLEDGIKVGKIFIYFLILYFLLATQDIAVDGWALTILRPPLRIHASACNSAGQSFGSNLAFFIILSSNTFFHDISNFFKFYSEHAQSDHKCDCHETAVSSSLDRVLTISGFMKFFGIVILITTFFLLFKKEDKEFNIYSPSPTPNMSFDLNTSGSRDFMSITDVEMGSEERVYRVWDSYKILKKVIMLPPIRTLGFLLLTKYLFFAPENPIDLKLLSYGLSQDLYAFSKSFTIFVDIIFPLVVSYYIVQFGVSNILYSGMMFRLWALILSTGFLGLTKFYFKTEHKGLSRTVYIVVLTSMILLRRTAQLLNSVADVALFNKISDPAIGAIYMTLLNTLANFGSFYPNYIALSLVDLLTFKKFHIDGIFVECFICIVCGFWFIPKFKLMFEKLNFYDERDWTVVNYT